MYTIRLWTIVLFDAAWCIHIASAQTSNRTVTPPPASAGLGSFYKKYVVYRDVAIVSSGRVPDEALQRVYDVTEVMLHGRPDIAAQLASNRIHVAIMAETEVATDLPEHADLYTTFPGTDWNTRTRGVGATLRSRTCSCAEENVLRYRTDRYPGEDIFVHEFAHTIDLLGVALIDSTWSARLRAAYNRSIAAGRRVGVYAGTNAQEYFAEGVQSWFNTNIQRSPSNGIHNDSTPSAEFFATTPRLVNVSVLRQIGPGFTVGFTVGGDTSRDVLLRAIGPGLAAVGVGSGTVPDPRLMLFAGSKRADENDNWGGGAALAATFSESGRVRGPRRLARRRAGCDASARFLSAQMTAVSGAGLVLVDVYEVP